MYIVAFNGPPYSGKDTLSRMLVEHIESRREVAPIIVEVSLSEPLRHMAYGMLNRVYGLHNPEFEAANYASFKEEYFERLDRTGRQLMIDCSERFLKPIYGEPVMADLLIQRLRHLPHGTLVLVRDSGFQVEVNPLIKEVGAANLCVVQVHRQGCDFANDSREWVGHPTGKNFRINNNGSLEDLRTEAGRIYGRLVNQLGWQF